MRLNIGRPNILREKKLLTSVLSQHPKSIVSSNKHDNRYILPLNQQLEIWNRSKVNCDEYVDYGVCIVLENTEDILFVDFNIKEVDICG